MLFPEDKETWNQWYHLDQGRLERDFASVQGIVYLTDSGVEGSHQVFGDYLDAHPSEGYSFKKLNIENPLYKNRRKIKLCVKAGHMVLFDSRTVHCNVSSRRNYRAAMVPRAKATEAELDKRRKLYENGRMTGHWCYGPWFKETTATPITPYNNLDPLTRSMVVILHSI